MNTIKFGKDRKLYCSIESTPDYPAQDLIRRKLPAVDLRFQPAEMLDTFAPNGDQILACIAGSPVARTINRTYDLRSARLPASGYKISYEKTPKGNCLVIIGGDLFGMLAGISEALLWSNTNRQGLVYRGGARLEKPAFPMRYYWTWDHSTNWMLDDPGNQVDGCTNQYLKKPETYLEDYRRLIDHCIDMRFNGVVIWGFLRDAHGGEQYAWEVANYAANRGIAIMPGVGTTGYGGIYYEGNHPCNLETYLAAHPKAGNIWDAGGPPSNRELSPYHEASKDWINECLTWLYSKFPIGGCNMENMDLMVDHSPAARRGRKKIRSGEKDHFKDQFFAYKSALGAIDKIAPQAWNAYATYSGFGTGDDTSNAGADMGRTPYFAKHMPESAIAQWTITGMISQKPVPMNDWLETGRPKAVYQNPNWPKGLTPPTPRSAGFIHQSSPWSKVRRSALAISSFAEGCLRSHEAGLEGISIHGEVTNRTLPWHINYLAGRHWTYHPVSSLQEFASAELAPRMSGEKEALDYVQALSLCEKGEDAQAWDRLISKWYKGNHPRNFPISGDHQRYKMWSGLAEWMNTASATSWWYGYEGTGTSSNMYGFGDVV